MIAKLPSEHDIYKKGIFKEENFNTNLKQTLKKYFFV